MKKVVRLNGHWTDDGERLHDIKGTPSCARLEQSRLYPGKHVYTVDLVTFDEDGNFTERTLPLTGVETTARKAQLAADRALRRYLSRTIEAA